MNNQIWNPNTQSFVSILSPAGRATLKSYIRSYMSGGALTAPEFAGQNWFDDKSDYKYLVNFIKKHSKI